MCVFLLWQGRGERDGVVISPPSIPNTVMHRAIFAVHLCVSEKEEKKNKQTSDWHVQSGGNKIQKSQVLFSHGHLIHFNNS